MYVLQTNADHSKSIIGELKSADNLLWSIRGYLVDLNIEHQYVETDMANLQNNSNYPEGYYLLKHNDTYQLVEKKNQVNVGYLYNSETMVVNLVHSWSLFPGDNLLAKTKKHDKRSILEFHVEDHLLPRIYLVCGGTDIYVARMVTTILCEMARPCKKTFYENTLVVCPNEIKRNFYKVNIPHIKVFDDWNSDLISNHLTLKNGCLIIDGLNISSLPENDVNCLFSLCAQMPKKISLILTSDVNFSGIAQKYLDYIDYFVLNLEENCSYGNFWLVNKNLLPNYEEFNNLCQNIIEHAQTIIFRRRGFVNLNHNDYSNYLGEGNIMWKKPIFFITDVAS